MKYLKRGLLVAACGLSVALPATAAQFQVTYTGTIKSGFDTTGVFTAPSTDLSGFAYVAQYIVDTGVGATSFDNGLYSSIDGLDGLSPIKASLTINGHSYLFGNKALTHGSAGQANFFDGSNHALYDEVSHFVQDFQNGSYFNYNWNRITSFDNNIVNTSDFTANLFYSAQPLDRLDGAFLVWEGSNLASGGFIPQTVRIQGVVASVPEPATWAMMIGGLGLAGAAMRRRKATVTFA